MKTVVMTGGTSGLGKVAAEQFLRTPGMRLIVGARKVGNKETETLPLDLSRLANVRTFADAVAGKMGGAPIDVLVLNAGTQFPDSEQRTDDGFETTFAVNHLAHYLLLRLLLPHLSQSAVVVITTSDAHDPALNPLGPRQLDPEQLAHPGQEPGRKQRGALVGFRVYSASKLCNLLTARALAASQEAKDRGLRVIAFNPGLTPDTFLYREWPLWLHAVMFLVRVLRPVLRLNTSAQAGQALASLAMGEVTPPPGRVYASLVRGHLTWPEPSELARSNDAMWSLWRDSARMVGLPS